MSEQVLLFDLRRPLWSDRLWRTIDLETRHEIVSILAEMGRRSLTPEQVTRTEEASDES